MYPSLPSSPPSSLLGCCVKGKGEEEEEQHEGIGGNWNWNWKEEEKEQRGNWARHQEQLLDSPACKPVPRRPSGDQVLPRPTKDFALAQVSAAHAWPKFISSPTRGNDVAPRLLGPP
ncbi:hypothetical protein Droror1_Dr00025691 [Drosera rotundifolia]